MGRLKIFALLFALSLTVLATPVSAQPAVVPDASTVVDAKGSADVSVDVKASPADVAAPADAADAKSADAAADAAADAKVVPAHKAPEELGAAISDVGLLVEAARNGNWVFFTGLLIMLLIFILDKMVDLKKRIPATAVPWVAATLGIVGSIAAQLTTGIPWGQAILQGFTSGVTAVGLWEMIFKHMNKKDPADPPKV